MADSEIRDVDADLAKAWLASPDINLTEINASRAEAAFQGSEAQLSLRTMASMTEVKILKKIRDRGDLIEPLTHEALTGNDRGTKQACG